MAIQYMQKKLEYDEDYTPLVGAVVRYLNMAGEDMDIAVLCAILGIETKEEANV